MIAYSQYAYDAINRLTYVSDADGRATTYAYDLAGNLARVSDTQSGDLLMSYDLLNRLIEVVALQGTVSYTYDAIGRRLTRTLSGGDVTSYTYDKANRLKSITLRDKTAAYTYDAAGRLEQRTLPNGLKVIYQYDNGDRPTSIAYVKPDNTPIDAVAYSYDVGGQRNTKTQGPAALQETPFNATYDEANRLSTIAINGETFSLSYDANGNLASKVGPNSGATTFNWSARNQLAELSGPSGSATFKYDALGRRIEKTVNGVTTGFLYDGAQAIAELKGGALDTIYHTGIAIDEVLAHYSASGNKTMLTDALMSVIAQANDDQSVGNLYAYSPYGQTTTLGPDEGNSLQYTGRELDGIGLYYYRARYYDPTLKRFISEDPIGITGGLNLYAYTHGNPVSLTDPSGQEVTMTCRPIRYAPAFTHCAVIVWHWEIQCGELVKVIDKQYTVSYGGTSPTGPTDPTYRDDRDAFNNPGGSLPYGDPNYRNRNYDIAPPPGMSQSDFDKAVTTQGDQYNQDPYRLWGPNSNTAASNIIQRAGGTVPNVRGAVGQ